MAQIWASEFAWTSMREHIQGGSNYMVICAIGIKAVHSWFEKTSKKKKDIGHMSQMNSIFESK
jgi:type IV secretory pathway TrbL component